MRCPSWVDRCAGRPALPSQRDLESMRVLLQDCGDPFLVLLRHRQQHLLHHVGQLGQPQVELSALLYLGLEDLDPVAQALGVDRRAEQRHPACQQPPACLQFPAQLCHSTTNRPIRCPVPISAPGLSTTCFSRATTRAPRCRSSSATRRNRSVRRWLRRAKSPSPRPMSTSTYSRPPPRNSISHARQSRCRLGASVASATLRTVTTLRPGSCASLAAPASTD